MDSSSLLSATLGSKSYWSTKNRTLHLRPCTFSCSPLFCRSHSPSPVRLLTSFKWTLQSHESRCKYLTGPEQSRPLSGRTMLLSVHDCSNTSSLFLISEGTLLIPALLPKCCLCTQWSSLRWLAFVPCLFLARTSTTLIFGMQRIAYTFVGFIGIEWKSNRPFVIFWSWSRCIRLWRLKRLSRSWHKQDWLDKCWQNQSTS